MRPTFGPLLVLIATWLFPAVAAWGQLNCTSCNPQFLEAESGILDTSCTAGSALDLLPDFLDYTVACSEGFSTAVAKFPLGNERECNGNRPRGPSVFLWHRPPAQLRVDRPGQQRRLCHRRGWRHVDHAFRQHRHLRGPHPQPPTPAFNSKWNWFWRCPPPARLDVRRRQHQLGRLRQHRGGELGHLASQTFDVKMVG